MSREGGNGKLDDAPVFLKDIDLSEYDFQGDEGYVAEALLGYMLEQRTMYIEETLANPRTEGENVRRYQAVGIDWRDMVMEIMAEDPQGINPYKTYGMVIMDGEPEDEYPKINENLGETHLSRSSTQIFRWTAICLVSNIQIKTLELEKENHKLSIEAH